VRKAICRSLWGAFLLCGIVVIIAEYCRETAEPCGIEVILWVEVVFGIGLIAALLQVQSYWILACARPTTTIFWYIGTMLLALVAGIAWNIYGLIIYFSEANNCQEVPDQFGWLVVMVIFLFVGLIWLIIFVVCSCCLALISCCVG